MHKKGTYYRWDDVPGQGDSYLRPGNDNQIVCAALKLDLNPKAPEIILVGEGRNIESKAKRLCKQSTPISVYLKRGTHKWEYCGEFVVERFSELEEEIRLHAQRSKHDKVVRIIYLKECGDGKENC